MPTIAILCAFGFFASLVDAVAGGGGLIAVPALFVFLPGLPPPVILATNKFSSTCGSAAAVSRYAASGSIIWNVALPAGITAILFSILGAGVVSMLDSSVVRPIIMILLVAVAAYVLLNKEMGAVHELKLAPRRSLALSIVVGAVLGFYEGFFGPGMGSFLVFILIGMYGFNFLAAAATGRLVNFAATGAALVYFMATGLVRYDVALPMAASTIVGGLVGSRLAIQHGGKFIRTLFLVVVAVLLAKLAYDTFLPR